MSETHYEVRWIARGWGDVDADRIRRFDTKEEALALFFQMNERPKPNVSKLYVAEVSIVAGSDSL